MERTSDRTIAKRRTRRAKSAGDRVFYGVSNTLLFLVLLMVGFPLWYIICASFSSSDAVISGQMKLWPVDFNIDAYIEVFKHSGIRIGYGNSAIYTVFGTAFNVVMTVAAAYPLSRRDFGARNILMFLFTFTMLFSGGMIPTYLVVSRLGLINTRLAMILPGAFSVYNIIITRTFFQANIPTELLEAAQLDGCSDFKFILNIVLPLSGAIIAVITLFYAVGHWNAYMSALIYLLDRKLYPLQVFLREILILNQFSVESETTVDVAYAAQREKLMELLKYALIVVASAPVMALYPFIQRYFVRGVMIGAIKG